MSSFMGELIGTMLLILLGDGVVAGVSLNKSKAQNSGWIVITTAWAIAVAVPAFMFGSISGSHFNPALTIALAAIGKFPANQVLSYIIAQMIGGILGAVLVYLMYLPHWKETEDANAKLGVFCTAPAIRNTGANFISEVIGTFMLVFGILGLGAQKTADGVGTMYVGLLIFVIGLSLGGPTGYAINPARDLAPRIAHTFLPIEGKRDSDWGYSWIPVLGPIVGGLIAAFLFQALF
ncbi:glycerol uptake facilitator protein [Clostridium tetanomorphum]|uniref:Aquaporin family protein n=1 Tax=Clostridium tetanomorphum TaxID=1553 RepID=A0A923E8L3_CLOTT|nr:MIP/aquaporin family protein [Clostridium tetanomorphum]KAJ53451.1 glycerol uptake facilitator protein [Clostridium tetanomorphum DSM 665]MBC2398475.1 aquaporin family protein [Clostridium tetanomorphum]MBP1865320.1 glycerol uptake facilitator protein [Clostridium tetanomorphum]NRS85243.1 glycerol uptake facilitator protein [Clostridium tetanomorphum]NRZ98420.1 glycerol uptake facilitator protein [Clostridium tetanomorphum]